jgi:transposase-like protein
MKRTRRSRPPVGMSSGFAGFRCPPEVILWAVRWYLRYGLSYRDREELLAERGIEVDHVTLYRWVGRFTPLLIDAPGRLQIKTRSGSETHRWPCWKEPACVAGRKGLGCTHRITW